MPDNDDELTALHHADPVDPASLPSPTDPTAAALFERITMTVTDTHPTASSPTRRRMRFAAVAAAVLVVAGVAIAATRGGDSSPGRDSATPPTDPGGPITPGGAASCVELYDLTTLTHRELALDGTVTGVNGDGLTLAVNRWYRGGDGEEITLNGATTLAGVTSAGDPVSLAPGTRLLVAGDGGFAWGCGFTQPYDPATAAAWADALSG